MEEYFILLENLMHENLYADILWLRLIDKYLINEFNLKRIKAVSWILYKKYDYGKLELVISVYVDDIFTARKQEIQEKIKYNINMKLNIQQYGIVNNFIGVYYEWVCDMKGS